MTKNNLIKLPLGETVRRSFGYVFFNMPMLVKIVACWFVFLIYELSTDFPVLCSLDGSACRQSWQQLLSMLFLSLASISILVATCRMIILATPPRRILWFSFGKRELRYTWKTIVFTAMVIFLTFIVLFPIGLLLKIAPNQIPPIFLLLSYVIPFGIVMALSRMFLVFPAVSVDNSEISFEKSWKITQGNMFQLFLGQLAMIIPVFCLMFAASLLYRALGLDGFISKLFFSILLYAGSFLDAALKASFFAHIYQYFIYFYNKDKVVASGATVEELINKP